MHVNDAIGTKQKVTL